MTPEQRKAVERLTEDAESPHAIVTVRTADLRALLALVREPVASVEGVISEVQVGHIPDEITIQLDAPIPAPAEGWAGRRVEVHAVDAGEEK